LTRAWQLRENVTAYDAMYIALAEALEATMITSDPSINEKGEVAFQGNLRRITDTAGRPDCQTPQQRDTHGRESFSARAGRSRRSLTPTISRAVTSSPSFSLPTQR
jgi:hypothetical protein